MARTGLGAHWLDHDSCGELACRGAGELRCPAGRGGSPREMELQKCWASEGRRCKATVPVSTVSLEAYQRLASLAQVLNVGSNFLPV